MVAVTDDRAVRRQLRLARLVAFVPFALLVRRFDWVNDDAYITFAYARSLAEGLGFVHHPAGPAVEGFSEPLFTLWMAVGLRLGFQPETFARVTTVAAMMVVVEVTLRLAAGPLLRPAQEAGPLGCEDTTGGGVAPPRIPQVLPRGVLAGKGASFNGFGALLATAGVLGGMTPLAVWATSGMGVAPFALAVLVVVAVTARFASAKSSQSDSARHLSMAAVTLVAARADGAWWGIWIIGAGIALARKGSRPPMLAAAGIGLASWVAITGWRLVTFGDWLPNTARAKLGFEVRALARGLDYAVHFALTFPGVLVLSGLTVFGLARRREPLVALVGVGLVATLTHAVLVGGDFMAFGRFLVPALPLLVIGAAHGVAALNERRRRVASLAALAGVALASALPAFDVPLTPVAWRAAFRFRHNPTATGEPQPFTSELEQWRGMCLRAEEWAVLGRDIARLTPEDASFVAGAVGAAGYFSRRRVFDRHGLLSREVAQGPASETLRSPGHDKLVPAAFFAAERPTYDEVGLWPESALALHPYKGRMIVLGPSERPGVVLWVLPGPGFDELHPGD